ncbi:flagellar protein FlgN [Arthrobacter deserti]|uniref:Flagellar protein FlgN n=1 Tax=Arthrobacter deserti TaxID=1742687 RepID=A0ABX1JT62_9MICC|nr:flagellar protein FlgN [Arthrobacter deserti]
MGAHELSATLWRERELLELLVFKLEEEQLLLTAGKSRWLQHATREVEQVLERVREAGLVRTVEVAALAAEWGSAENATLRELVEQAPAGPWGEIFNGHLRALAALAAQIKELRDTTEQFLRAAARSSQETMAGMVPEPGTYDARGLAGPSPSAARLFDTTL